MLYKNIKNKSNKDNEIYQVINNLDLTKSIEDINVINIYEYQYKKRKK